MRFVFLIMLFCATAFAQSGDLVERNFTGSSSEKSVLDAKKDIQDQAVNKISEEIIKEIIGEENFSKRKTAITQKVVRLSSRYIPFSKVSEPDMTSNPGFTQMTMSMKVSLSNLKTLLKEQGFLNDNESAPVVIPMITFNDKVEMKNYRWWIPTDRNSKSFLNLQSQNVENSLYTAFQKNGFYLIRPMDARLVNQVPVAFQNERLNSEDQQMFGDLFSAPVLIDGYLNYSKHNQISNAYQVELHLIAMQISNGRIIADVSRRYDTEAGLYVNVVNKKMKEVIDAATSDLATQMLDIWQKGSLGSSVYKLTIQGYIPLKDQEPMKEKLKAQLSQMRNLREKFISSELITYEYESNNATKELATKLAHLEINGKNIDLVSVSENEIILKVKRP